MTPENLLSVIMFLPLFGALFVISTKNESVSAFSNLRRVAVLTICTNILLILKLFSMLRPNLTQMQPLFVVSLLGTDQTKLVFGTDTFSLLLMLAAHIAFLVCLSGMRPQFETQKPAIFFSLGILSALNGYFTAMDIFSYCVFFILMLFLLIMQIGTGDTNVKYKVLIRFFLYQLLGTSLLLTACVMAYNLYEENILISAFSEIKASQEDRLFIFSFIFLSLIIRMPVWPLHYWMNCLNNLVKNPLILMCISFLPISALYGITRFWALNVPQEITGLTVFFEILCVLTMIFISFRSYSTIELKNKLFSFILIYEFMYLIGTFLPTDILQTNIAYSLFAFILLSAVLFILYTHIEHETFKQSGLSAGILCAQPKTSFIYSMFVLGAIGLPVSALFWNNFIILSEIFNHSLYLGIFVACAILLAAISLLQNLYVLKDKSCLIPSREKITDIGFEQLSAAFAVMIILFLSFIKPLWFVF